MSTQQQLPAPEVRERLHSWKEIAAFLGRSERTVRRWEEKEGLPVHRLAHEKRGSIFAYRSELDEWWNSRRSSVASPESPEAESQEAEARELESGAPVVLNREAAGARFGHRKWMIAAGIASFALIAAGGYTFYARQTAKAKASSGIPEWYNGDAEAYRAYLRGAGFGTSFSKARTLAALAANEEAIRLNPSFARAWAQLGAAQVALTWFDDSEPGWQTMGRARKTAARLHELDPASANYWRIEGWALELLDFDYPKAEEYRKRAAEATPPNISAVRGYAEFLDDQRRFDEALVWAKRAVDLAPVQPTSVEAYGTALYFAGRPDEAERVLTEAVQGEPNAGLTRMILGRVLLDRKQYAEAVQHFRKADELVDAPFTHAELGRGLAIAGQREEAKKILAEMESRRNKSFYPAYAFAMVHVGLGDRKETFDWLEKAADERNTGFYTFYGDRIYDSLRGDPRYIELARKMKFIK